MNQEATESLARPLSPESPALPSPRVKLGEAAIDALTLSGAVDAVERLVRGGGGYVVTPNVDHLVNLEDSEPFRAAYREAGLVLADGMPVVWASRLLGRPLPERVAGADLVIPLCERAAARRWRVYLLGGAPGVAQAAGARLRDRFGVNVVGCDGPRIAPGTPEDQSAAAIARIREAAPDLVFVGLGSPKQELWLHSHAAELRPAVCLGVGAAIDFAAGRVRRAPRWISAAGMEWLYRLVQEPRRLWRRYLVNDPRFLAIVVRDWKGSGAAVVRRARQ